MAVYLFFGLPGAGKTTIMTALSLKYRKKYKHIYGNVDLAIDGYTYIDNSCIGKYDLSYCALMIDEATLFADSRDYKNFTRDKLEYFLEHRHHHADIYLFTQQWDGVDRKIRCITDRVYYVYKGKFLGKWFTKYYRIPYGIIIPDPKKDSGSDRLGEIVQGYCKPDLFVRLFAPIIFRPMYYKYFDSFERRWLPDLPPEYHEYDKKNGIGYWLKDYPDYILALEEYGMYAGTEDNELRHDMLLESLKKIYMKDLEVIVKRV